MLSLLIRVKALPDEIERSYLGVIMRVNGLAKEIDAVALMAAWAGTSARTRSDVSCVELLSRVAGMDVSLFVREHTTLPLRRGITSYLPALAHGSLESRSMLWTSAMRPARPGAFFCPDCVAADQDFHGRSYWRREHQLPGVLWCSKHVIGLHYRDEQAAFLRSPSQFMSDAKVVDRNWVKRFRRSASMKRFLDISAGLMETTRPFDVRAVRDVLRCRAKEQGYLTYSNNPKRSSKPRPKRGPSDPLLSDAVREAFDADWLAQVLPQLADKIHGDLLSRIDGVLWMTNSASSTVAYVLAASVLFESGDAALRAFATPAASVTERRTRVAISASDNEILRTQYVAHRGSHTAVSHATGLRLYDVTVRLRELGLPNLTSASRHANLALAAAAFYLDGKALTDSASAGNVSVSKLETIVRGAGIMFRQALREMKINGRAAPRQGSARAVPLLPQEVRETVGPKAIKFTQFRLRRQKQVDPA